MSVMDNMFRTYCENCKFNNPGRKSDCMIKKGMVYDVPCSEQFHTWCEGQTLGGNCKQRKMK